MAKKVKEDKNKKQKPKSEQKKQKKSKKDQQEQEENFEDDLRDSETDKDIYDSEEQKDLSDEDDQHDPDLYKENEFSEDSGVQLSDSATLRSEISDIKIEQLQGVQKIIKPQNKDDKQVTEKIQAPQPKKGTDEQKYDGKKKSQKPETTNQRVGAKTLNNLMKNSEKQELQIQHYVKILNGEIIDNESIKKRKQEEKIRQKLQTKMAQILNRRKYQSQAKQFDQKSQKLSSVKHLKLSTNSTTKLEAKLENMSDDDDSTMMKAQLSQTHSKSRPINRKKRTYINLKIIQCLQKDFGKMAEQQNNGISPHFNMSFQSISKTYGLSKSTVSKLYTEYLQDPIMRRRISSYESRNRQSKMGDLTKIRLEFVRKLLEKDCALTLRQIAEIMNRHDELKFKKARKPGQSQQDYKQNCLMPIASKAVQRLLKLGNYTKKKVQLVPKNRNSPKTVQQRFYFCQVLKDLIQDSTKNIYFLDECRFNLFTSRAMGWAPIGKLATKVSHNSKGKDIMILAIIGREGLVGYQLSDSYNRGSFTVAVTKLVNNFCSKEMENNKTYLILDNCPIHNKDNLKYLQSTLPLTILYLPPYTPMLNPIQYWFNQLKAQVRQRSYKTRNDMKKQLQKIVQGYKGKSMNNYYDNIYKYIALGLKKQLFR